MNEPVFRGIKWPQRFYPPGATAKKEYVRVNNRRPLAQQPVPFRRHARQVTPGARRANRHDETRALDEALHGARVQIAQKSIEALAGVSKKADVAVSDSEKAEVVASVIPKVEKAFLDADEASLKQLKDIVAGKLGVGSDHSAAGVPDIVDNSYLKNNRGLVSLMVLLKTDNLDKPITGHPLHGKPNPNTMRYAFDKIKNGDVLNMTTLTLGTPVEEKN
jgi:hypothetical protein